MESDSLIIGTRRLYGRMRNDDPCEEAAGRIAALPGRFPGARKYSRARDCGRRSGHRFGCKGFVAIPAE
jgi:hypothetical protein